MNKFHKDNIKIITRVLDNAEGLGEDEYKNCIKTLEHLTRRRMNENYY